MGVRSIRLLTNNPAKIDGLTTMGVQVSGRVAFAPDVNPENERYLQTKITRMNHLLNLVSRDALNGHRDELPDQPGSKSTEPNP
jgi:hypothetical protein